VNALLANRLGRPDLVGIPVDPYGGSSGIAQAGLSAAGSIGGSVASAGLEGRATAGVLIVGLLIVAGFYVWTRGVQA
jgi:hypothetical protein